MHIYARLAIGVAAVAVLAVVGINLLSVNRGIVAGPTASPAASAAAAQSPSPSNSPAARVDASTPADDVQAPPSSGDPAPSGSAASQPPPTADPELVRAAAALQYQADGIANLQAFRALYENNKRNPERYTAELWGQYLAALNQLQVPADTAADLRDLIRKVTRVQAAERESATAVGDAWWRARRHIRDRTSRMVDAANRVRADLGLEGVHTGFVDQGPSGYP
jgi:hypothetical protein